MLCNVVCLLDLVLIILSFKITIIFKQEPVQLAEWSRARTCQMSYRLGRLVLVLLFRRVIKVLEQKQL